MKKVRIKVPKTVGIYRIKYRDTSGVLHDPKREGLFEARVQVVVGGKSVTKSIACKNIHEARNARSGKAETAEPRRVNDGHTFLEVVQDWKGNFLSQLARSTRYTYEGCLRHLSYFEDKHPKEIGRLQVLEWLRQIKKPSYVSTQKSTRVSYRHEWIVLRSILTHYQENFDESYNLPFLRRHVDLLKVKNKTRQKKDMSLQEFTAFEAELRKICTDDRMVFLYLARFQYAIYGRIQDAAALHHEDFDFKSMDLSVQRKIEWSRRRNDKPILVNGSKTGEGKVIPITPYLKRIYREWAARSGRIKGLLLTYKGKPLTYRPIQYYYDLALGRAGIRFTGTHLLRHASLSEVYEKTKDLKVTADLGGHASIVTTQRYAKARDHSVREAQERMSRELMAVLDA